jgi:hypothetical protein
MAKKYLSLEGLAEYDALIKAEIDASAEAVKNDLLNGAGTAYDTLKELGDLIDDNQDAIEALEIVATNKADKEHNHDDVYETKTDAQTKYDTITAAKADWNQNDANAIDYIKNRTHWVEQATEVVVPATTNRVYSCDLVSGWGGINFNATYIVTLDGTTYQCTPWRNSFGEFCLGDSRLIMTWNDGEEVADATHPEDVPFHVNSYAEGDDLGGATTEYWYFTYPDSETHTIEIATLSDGNAV